MSSDNIIEVGVVDVLWNPSRHGLLKPIVKYDKVKLCGAYLEQATAHNARFIVENNIGPGSVIKITRSGDVIP